MSDPALLFSKWIMQERNGCQKVGDGADADVSCEGRPSGELGTKMKKGVGRKLKRKKGGKNLNW